MKKTDKDILPLAISAVLVLISLWMWLIHSYVLEKEFYLGMLVLMTAVILYFMARKVYLYFFAIALLAGLLGFIDFYYITLKIELGMVNLNPIFIAIFILYFVFSKDNVNKPSSFGKEKPPN
ncbi:hypothetical protein [Spongiimicrobium salis]|uniref:hypothetical protein n=1 Tax=Spongiimicrobium salis TaxID=1667022 RepID=UPI00374DB80B